MEIDKSDLKTEPLPEAVKSDYVSTLIKEIQTNESLTREEINEKLEIVLIERAKCRCEFNNNQNNFSTCKCHSVANKFILGQFFFDLKKFSKAYEVFETIKNHSYAALFQLGVIFYDELVDKEKNGFNEEVIDTLSSFHNPNKIKWEKGFESMLRVATLSPDSAETKKLAHSAQYNVGKAYYQGFGVKQSDREAEKWWLLAADDGSPTGCVNAMTALAFFYSRQSDSEIFSLEKAFFWHNEACGNGSLESQGALGAIYYFGIGKKQNMSAAYECLTESSERGNVYSMALLSDYYYRNKFYVKANELSKKVAILNEVEKIAAETNCLRGFVCKGIALASFVQARCLELGKGAQQDSQLAKQFYKRSHQFDPDLCKLFQLYVTQQRI